MVTLTEATVQRVDDDVIIVWQVDDDPSSEEEWFLGATLVAGQNGPIDKFGLRVSTDRTSDAHHFDPQGVKNVYVDVIPQRVGRTWSARFPAPDSVARSGHWFATVGSADQPDSILSGEI